ncbi:hypothetical protein ACWCZ5_03325, partial [Streptomyces sp. NPDC001667]
RRGLAFASGLAAEDCLLRTLLSPGDHVVIRIDVSTPSIPSGSADGLPLHLRNTRSASREALGPQPGAM